MCGARAHESRLLFIPSGRHVIPEGLEEYWRKNVDPRHRHEWVVCAKGTNYFLTTGAVDYVAGSNPRWMLTRRFQLVVLQALPSSNARKTFMEDLWSIGLSDRIAGRNIVYPIRMAYDENPKRTDWPKILREVGCDPVTGHIESKK
jgi:hypothetical protein